MSTHNASNYSIMGAINKVLYTVLKGRFMSGLEGASAIK